MALHLKSKRKKEWQQPDEVEDDEGEEQEGEEEERDDDDSVRDEGEDELLLSSEELDERLGLAGEDDDQARAPARECMGVHGRSNSHVGNADESMPSPGGRARL